MTNLQVLMVFPKNFKLACWHIVGPHLAAVLNSTLSLVNVAKESREICAPNQSGH